MRFSLPSVIMGVSAAVRGSSPLITKIPFPNTAPGNLSNDISVSDIRGYHLQQPLAPPRAGPGFAANDARAIEAIVHSILVAVRETWQF
ncbi:hypothetical protein BDV41DRAFT_531817 [Aspergillus transmontanensis]|uniref:Uncharacterized protein n=1 Tax=Aspergillus transmontanensis TaxID=1034304 RepID=A0A5N6W2Q5_9EURO|nr:hypothetical protein BDV41DRAFT_531817 [Aspergillus transmontanensis]